MSVASPPSLPRIVAAFTVNRVGTWFGLLAVSLTVWDHTHSGVAVAAALATPMLPALLAPAVVARVEASRRRGTLALLFALEALLAVAIAALLWRFWLPGVLVLVGLDGGIAYAANALVRSEGGRSGDRRDVLAVVPEGEGQPRGHDHRANASLNVALSLSGIVGPALAGPAVGGLGGPVALLIDAGSFLVCGLLMLGARPYVGEAESSVRARVAAVRAHIRSDPRLRALFVTEAIAFVFFTCALPVEVVYAKAALHAGDGGYGALLGVWGAGMVAGSLLFARTGGSSARRMWWMTAAGALAVGLAYLGFAAAPSLRLACLAALLGGIGNGVQWAALIGIVQELSPRRLQGRMMGAVEALGSAAPVAGFLLGGALAGFSSPRTALLVAGAGACAMAAVFQRVARLPAPVPTARAAGRFAAAPGAAPVAPAGGEPALTPLARE